MATQAKIAVTGVSGRMGQMLVATIARSPKFGANAYTDTNSSAKLTDNTIARQVASPIAAYAGIQITLLRFGIMSVTALEARKSKRDMLPIELAMRPYGRNSF